MLAAAVRDVGLERQVFFPLMTYVQYRGRAILCSSMLPLSKGSLIYGSADGGKTVLRSDAQFNELAEKIARTLNLRAHLTGPEHKPVELVFAVETKFSDFFLSFFFFLFFFFFFFFLHRLLLDYCFFNICSFFFTLTKG